MKKSVLILGAGPRTVVVIARSLHKHSIPVIVALMSPSEREVQSSAIAKYVILPNFREKPVDFISTLVRIIQSEDIDMIIPAGDGPMAAVAQHYDELTKYVYVRLPPPLVTERVLDKRLTLAAARKCGIPIASTQTINESSKVSEIINELRFPLIAKPAVRKGVNFYKIKYFIDKEEFLKSIKSNPDWFDGALLQEYIPGIGIGIGVLMHKGIPLAMFQHRRLKEYPYTGGVSVMAESEAVDSVLGNHAIELLREIEWEGIAMVEYRFDPRDKSFVLMEVNGRYWGSLFIAVKCGMDFPYYDWQIAHGEQPTVPDKYRIGIKARWLSGDIRRLFHILDGSHLSRVEPISVIREITQFVKDFNPKTQCAVFTLTDPRPAMQELGETLGKLCKMSVKRLILKACPPILLEQLRIYRRFNRNLRLIFVKQQMRRLSGQQPILFNQNKTKINSVLFVCLGNIIRSPTAALTLKRKLAISDKGSMRIESAGVWEELMRINPRPSPDIVVKAAIDLGISLTEHRSKPLTEELVESCDLIFVMDYRNEAMLLARYPTARPKIFLLGACIEKVSILDWEISDPNGKDFQTIQRCLARINTQISGLAKILLSQNS